MKKVIFRFFLVLFISFTLIGCKYIAEENLGNLIKEGETIYLDIYLSKNIKINGKTILFDLTSDIKKHLSLRDTTEDILNSGDYIYKKEDIEQYNYYENILVSTLLENVRSYTEKELMYINIQPYNTIVESNSRIVTIEIDDYNEGEFNLIKNIPTTIRVFSKLYKNELRRGGTILLIKQYKQESDINNAIEKLRIESVSDMIADDFVKYLNKNYISKIKEEEILMYKELERQKIEQERLEKEKFEENEIIDKNKLE